MNIAITESIKESVRQELLVSEFYELFEKTFHEDSGFWYQLKQEEIKHGATLQAERDYLFEAGLMPDEIVASDLETLEDQNSSLESFLEELRNSPPSREQAFSIAIALEEVMIESIYQSCIDNYPESKALKLFQTIASEEKEHIERILQYASREGIDIDMSINYFTLNT